MTLEQLLADLPTACDSGVKRNAKGHQARWQGYKLHIDAIDGPAGELPVDLGLAA